MKKSELNDFSGNPDLEAEWLEFCANKLGSEGSNFNINDLNLLNILAFEIPKEGDSKKLRQSLTKFIIEHSAGDIKSFRERLVRVVALNSGDKTSSPLNKEITEGLVNIWIALEKSQPLPEGFDAAKKGGLPNLPDTRNLLSTKEWQLHEELGASDEGSLVRDLIESTCKRIISTKSREAYEIRGGSAGLDVIKSEAYEIFRGALYRYEEDGGANFFTYLTMHLKYKLLKKVNKQTDSGAVSGNVPVGDEGKELLDLVADEKAKDPDEVIILSDQVDLIKAVIPEILSDLEAKVFTLFQYKLL